MLLRAKRDGQWWILKGLKPKYREDFIYQELLRKEYNILMRVKSHYVVAVAGMENVDGYGECIVMEWIRGTTLEKWLQAKHSRQEKRRVIDQLLDAVESINFTQVVHRDLKPSNVMITHNGQNVKLIDFGLSDSDSYAVFKQPAGTGTYMSPEQQSTTMPDSRNDIYSLGTILRQMGLPWIYHRVICRCHAPMAKRYGDAASLRAALRSVHRRFHVACVLMSVLFVLVGTVFCFHEFGGPRQIYEIVADFKVGYLRCQSWGGGQVTVKCTSDVDPCVEIPRTVAYGGTIYRVTEITFNAFRNHKNLRHVVLPNSGQLHVMEGAFTGCPGLGSICFRSPKPCSIGNQLWKTDITKVFDPTHFSRVTLYVPKGSLGAYRQSAWGRFKNIKEYQ